jgi:uncharacterized delta-60 repeat protein
VVAAASIRRLGAGLLLAAVLMLATAGGASARPGGSVFSYGYFGTVDITAALPGLSSEKRALAMAIGPQDETIVASSRVVPCASSTICFDLFVTRYDAKGVLDPGFGSRAGVVMRVETPNGPGALLEPRAALAVGKDGRTTIAAGTGGGLVLTRLGPDGTPDPSFGVGGRVATALGGAGTAIDVSLGSGGTTLVTGGLTGPTGDAVLLTRYTSSGQLDPGFGAGGITIDGLGAAEPPAAVGVKKGKAFVGLPNCCSAAQRMRVGLFAANGSRSGLLGFGLPARLKAGPPRGVAGVIPQAHGSVEVVGTAKKGTFVARLLASGKPDPSFGDRGFALVRGFFVEGPPGALIDSQGRIVLSGWRYDPPDTEGKRARVVRLFRLLANGRPDPKFGGVRPLLTVSEGTRKVGLDIGRSLGFGIRSDGRIGLLGESVADPREGVGTGPWFGLSLFLGK